MKHIVGILLILIPFFHSCKKDVLDVNPDYSGNWIGPDGKNVYYLTIDDNSKGFYSYEKDEQIIKEKHGVMRLDGDRLVMGGMFIFTVTEEPIKLDSAYTFMLHGYENPVTWSVTLKNPGSLGGADIKYYKE